MNTVPAGKLASRHIQILVSRFVGDATFPATGKEVVETARRNGAPEHLMHALQRLTPGKIFDDITEVWLDVVHPQRTLIPPFVRSVLRSPVAR
jgi:Protein of unknown function (DUF2795)